MANLYIDCKFKNKLKIDTNSEKIQVIFIIKANSSAIKQRASKSFGIRNIINAKF